MKFDSIIVRFGGEIGIKGRWTRRAYERLLLQNIKAVLAHKEIRYKGMVHRLGRIYIKAEDDAKRIASELTRVFGVSSASPSVETTSDVDEILHETVKLAEGVLEKGMSFAVRCRRVGKHQYSSMDICRRAGEQILKQLKDRSLKVDLRKPQATISIEVRDEDAYILSETLQGIGGFPLGSQSKVLCLLSGGIDSPVACWLAMKRGCPIIPLYFDNTPFTGETTTATALHTARRLFEWAIGFPRKMLMVPHGINLDRIVRETPKNLTCILCKRMMYRIAERIAEAEKAEGIITGEAIGEQASQTLHNLRVLNEAVTKYPVHRPLLGFNKQETECLARKIGTFKIPIRKTEGCSAASKRPATKARIVDVKRAEQKLDIARMVDESVRAAKTVTV